MIQIYNKPSIITSEGTKPKLIEEYIGKVNSNTDAVSIARMKSPEGWTEPGQKPEFDEYTVVLSGNLQVETKAKTVEIRAGQAILVTKNEWVRYSSPKEGGAEYISVCLPAFTPEGARRDY